MEFKRIDHHQAEAIADTFPTHFLDIVRPIPAKEGHAYKVPSLTDTETAYRCAVVRREDGWYGKCECTGWPRTKSSQFGKKPCKHIAAALILQNDYDPDEIFPENQAPAKEPPIDLRKEYEEKKAAKQKEVNPFSDRPLEEDVPDASPFTHSNAVVEAAPKTGSLVRPVATIQETRAAFRAFQDAKLGLLEKNDVQKVYDGNFIKKSGWRKIAVFFGLSLQKIDEREINHDGQRIYAVTYRAIAPGGQFQDATGYCSWNEAGPAKRAKKSPQQAAKLEHDVRATAETRAKNRAIADLVGGGEVSAEEMRLVGSWRSND